LLADEDAADLLAQPREAVAEQRRLLYRVLGYRHWLGMGRIARKYARTYDRRPAGTRSIGIADSARAYAAPYAADRRSAIVGDLDGARDLMLTSAPPPTPPRALSEPAGMLAPRPAADREDVDSRTAWPRSRPPSAEVPFNPETAREPESRRDAIASCVLSLPLNFDFIAPPGSLLLPVRRPPSGLFGCPAGASAVAADADVVPRPSSPGLIAPGVSRLPPEPCERSTTPADARPEPVIDEESEVKDESDVELATVTMIAEIVNAETASQRADTGTVSVRREAGIRSRRDAASATTSREIASGACRNCNADVARSRSANSWSTMRAVADRERVRRTASPYAPTIESTSDPAPALMAIS
jgi:hypothetical protein